MRILITGNLGYVGPVVGKHLSQKHNLTGFDTGYFTHCLTDLSFPCDRYYQVQYHGDIRELDESILKGVHGIVHLSAISNDPMGKMFEDLTPEINFRATARLASLAKKVGVKYFTFASSCSVYGTAKGGDKRESSPLNPLTAYARSKCQSEEELGRLADPQFKITCLRFSTACGWSPRLRLDLVLNDFVAGALVNEEIKILSDGSPWRPLIDVSDMARAIEWSFEREIWMADPFVVVNVGSKEWNFQVKDLADAVQKVLGEKIRVSINLDASPDKRSYRVDFSFFEKIAPLHQPQKKIRETVQDIADGLKKIGFKDSHYHSSYMIRLHELVRLREQNALDGLLHWRQ